MDLVKLHDKSFKPYISEKELSVAVRFLAEKVYEDIKDEEGEPVFIGILNGSFMFMADFVRAYPANCKISFVKLSSYQGDKSTGDVKELVGLNEDLTGRTVVILEDIIDTGNTLHEIYKIFSNKNIKQLKIATLFFKPEVFRKELQIDYIGLSIPDKFIVGYGLDYDGLGRQFPNIYQVIENSEE